jgi:HD-like signal output (HDOD) protein
MLPRMPVALALTRDQILDHARALPAAPKVLAELCELLQDINTDLDQIAVLVRTDPALAARVIRISNSVVYGGEWQVSSIDEAVNRVGFEEVLRLVGTASVAGFVDRAVTIYRLEAEQLRSSLLMHALSAEALARFCPVDTRAAYTAGLLRAIGMLVLDRAARERLTEQQFFDAAEFPTYLDWELARFGVGMPDVTRMILDEWRFPHDVVTAIEQQFLQRASDYENPFACVVNLAGAVAHQSGLALPGDEAHWTVIPEKLGWAGMNDAQFAAAAEDAKARYDRQSAGL